MSDRVLLFPDVAAGFLHVHVAPGHEWSVAAQGAVRVPAAGVVTLAALTPIRGLEKLRPDDLHGVSLPKWSATDDDFARLSHLTGLVALRASKSDKVTDRGLAALRFLHRLEELDLYHSAVTDDGLRHLAGMVALRDLHLGATRVKGPGLSWLAGLPRLEYLVLHDTDVDDAAVPALLELHGLKQLSIFNTLLSVRGLAALRDGLPGLTQRLHMPNPGRRLARKRVRDAVRGILAGRILPHLPEGITLRRDMADLRVMAVRRPDGIVVPLQEGLDDEQALVARFLARQPMGSDVRVVGPGGLDVWLPWLRSRRSDRRSVRRRAD